jgi:hypothetical protein
LRVLKSLQKHVTLEVFMRYTFKPKNQDRDICAETNTDNLIIIKDEELVEIPYAAINKVKLEKCRDEFFIEIDAGHFGSFQIHNATYSLERQRIDQSRLYHTFVRIFHYHLLKGQCSATFISQFRQSDIEVRFLLWALLAAFVYLLENYVDFLPLNSSTLAVSILVLGMCWMLTPYIFRRSRQYNPSDIPLEMLPPAS